MPPDQNPPQTVTFSGCIWCWCTSCGFLLSQNRQFCLLTKPFIQKWASSLKMIFLPNSWSISNCSKIPISEYTALSLVVYFNFLGSWISWILYGCRPKSWRKIRQTEVTERPSSCERREIDFLVFSRTAAILPPFRWRTSVGWLIIEPVNSNLATKRRIVDSAGRLWRG